jgi:hypothetical protein
LPLPAVQNAWHDPPAPQGPPTEQPAQVPPLHQRLAPHVAHTPVQGLAPLEQESHTLLPLHQLPAPQLPLPQ